MSLAQGLISLLTGKGILTPEQTNDLFRAVLTSLDQFEPPDAGADKARVLVDGIAKAVAQHFAK